MTADITERYLEPHRPQIHFSPAENWMNDPNGLVFYKGVYHLFYQHNPGAHVWGNMHWGHATSKDLVYWEHRPIALFAEPDGLGYIFSGSAVVDWRNTSGLGTSENPPLVALFTHSSHDGFQVQSLAYSLDAGENWQMYEGNPVLGNPDIQHFRDPKVIWDTERQCWVMALAAQDVVKFYSSANLLSWQFLSDFGEGVGSHGGIWECPDLFPLRDPYSGRTKWVLIVSEVAGAPNEGSGTQYFIGNFDGERFTPEHQEVLWLDYGPDNYAGVTWSDEPDSENQRSFIGWMSNWRYANDVPTSPWRGVMTIPRSLRLVHTPDGLRLASPPVHQLERLSHADPVVDTDIEVRKPFSLVRDLCPRSGLELTLDAETSRVGSGFVVELSTGQGESMSLTLDLTQHRVTLDRRPCAVALQSNDVFYRELSAPLTVSRQTHFGLQIIIDQSSLELFDHQGLGLLTSLYFSDSPITQISIKPMMQHESIVIKRVARHVLHSIWSPSR